MGFIDYHGTKEDRYSEMLDFAKAQQEEETRRIMRDKAIKWVSETMKIPQYAETAIPDLIRLVMVQYRKLFEIKEQLVSYDDAGLPETKVLWDDFCIYCVHQHIGCLYLSGDKQETYYNTIMEKVFKIEGFTPWEKHNKAIMSNKAYKKYFADCFDLAQEKQFWKWIGKCGETDKDRLEMFVETYEQLSVLLGYYLFYMVWPKTEEWMKRLETEKQILDRIKMDYLKRHLKEPVYYKLRNPLYYVRGMDNEHIITGDEREILWYVDETGKITRPQLNRELFSQLIQKQNLMDYVEACKLIRKCELPEKMDTLFNELIYKIPILQETILKFQDVYQADLFQLNEYYIIEALQLTATYLEYLNVGIELKVLNETENNVYDAVQTLVIAVEDKINEIYQYGSMEMKARSKALESIMNQDGHVKPAHKLN